MTSHAPGPASAPKLQASVPAQDWPRRHRVRAIDRLIARAGSVVERAFFVFLMVNLSGAIIPPQQGQIVLTGEYSLVDSAFAVLYLVIAVLIAMRFARFTRTALAHPPTLAMLAFAGLSWLWTTAPDLTSKRAIAIVVTTAVGWYLACRFSMRQIIEIIAVALGITGLISTYYGIVDPSVATLAGEGNSWRGVYDTKNTFARAMVLGAASFLLLSQEPRRWRWLAWAGVGLCSVMVLLSRSATGLVVLCALVILVKFVRTLRIRTIVLVPLLIVLGIGLVVAVAWLQMNPDVAVGPLGKDRTLTGRTDLWAVALTMIEQRPWLGYGYSAFWRDGAPGPAAAFWAAVGWRTPHSHNGFIDLALDLGLVGLLVFLVGLVTATIKALRRARTGRTIDAVAPLVLVTYTVLYNLSESSLFKHNTLYWVVYVVAVAGAYGAGSRQHRMMMAVPGGHLETGRGSGGG